MATPDVVSARLKKLNVCVCVCFLCFFFFFFWFFVVVLVLVLGLSALCINDHRTQNQSLKQATLAFYDKFPV